MTNKLPVPVGYRLLIKIPEANETYGDGGLIVKPHTTQGHDKILSILGEVVAMGGGAYKDSDRFPDGPWCSVGDHVMFRANTGTRFMVDDTEYRLMNDDNIEAVVGEPRAIKRIM